MKVCPTNPAGEYLHSNFVGIRLTIRKFSPLERRFQFLKDHRMHVNLHKAIAAIIAKSAQ